MKRQNALDHHGLRLVKNLFFMQKIVKIRTQMGITFHDALRNFFKCDSKQFILSH